MSLTSWVLLLVGVAVGVFAWTRKRKALPTTLFAAASAGDVAKVRSLLQEGVNAAFRNEEWISPLGVAIANGHMSVVRVLLDAGVDPNAPAIEDQPALFVAVSYLRTALVPELVRAGASLDFAHPEGGGALGLAIVKRDTKTIEALLSAGVPVGLRNAGGAREIHGAALVGDQNVTKLLIERGADIQCPNFQGGTPLRSAASAGHAGVVRLLLEAGADPSPVDAFEKRPIDYAKEGGHKEVVKILERAKPNPVGRCDCRKESPLARMLPPRGDATLQAVRHAKAQGLTLMDAGASALEAPSMIAVARSVVGTSFKVDFTVDEASDPRLPTRAVDLVLWTYQQSGKLTNEAVPAVPPPPDDVVRHVAMVAEYPYVLSAWSKASAGVARKLRPEDLSRVLAVMVHPPAAPAYVEPWDWYLRVQVAAALVASHLGERPWAESPSRTALEGIMDGPADWTNTAAVIALLDVARRDESARATVVQALIRTARRPINPPAYQHAIKPAALALLEIPGVSAEVLEEMKELTNEE